MKVRKKHIHIECAHIHNMGMNMKGEIRSTIYRHHHYDCRCERTSNYWLCNCKGRWNYNRSRTRYVNSLASHSFRNHVFFWRATTSGRVVVEIRTIPVNVFSLSMHLFHCTFRIWMRHPLNWKRWIVHFCGIILVRNSTIRDRHFLLNNLPVLWDERIQISQRNRIHVNEPNKKWKKRHAKWFQSGYDTYELSTTFCAYSQHITFPCKHPIYRFYWRKL